MKSLQKKNAALYAACPAEKAARTDRLQELTVLWKDQANSKNRIEELAWRLREGPSAREYSFADK